MDTITVLTDNSQDARPSYLAVSGEQFALGESIGSAVDGVVAKVGGVNGTTLVVLRSMQADEFFSELQRQRLGELRPRLSSATEPLSGDELNELHRLVQEELVAAGRRSAALLEKSRR